MLKNFLCITFVALVVYACGDNSSKSDITTTHSSTEPVAAPKVTETVRDTLVKGIIVSVQQKGQTFSGVFRLAGKTARYNWTSNQSGNEMLWYPLEGALGDFCDKGDGTYVWCCRGCTCNCQSR